MIQSNNSAACSVCFGSGFDVAGKPCPFAPHRDAATLKAAQGGVTEAMVERALIRYAMLKDQAVWPDAYSDDELEMERRDMRAALESALSAEPAAQGEDGTQPSRPKPRMPISPLGIEDFCYCDNTVSLQAVSGGGAPEGYLGKVQLKVNGEFVTYVREATAPPAQPAERVPGGCVPIHRTLLDKLAGDMDAIDMPKIGAAIRRWVAAYDAKQTASPAPSEGGKGVARTLAKYQPCGCVICTCEDEVQCHGCGARMCGTHPDKPIPHPIYERHAPEPAAQGEAWPAPPWLPIDQLPESDDLFWFLRGDTVDGPRPPQFGGYDADEWDYFAPCVEPPAECTAPPAQPVERVPEEATDEFVPRWWDDSHGGAYKEGWNDCRAAMLAATHATPAEERDGKEGVR